MSQEYERFAAYLTIANKMIVQPTLGKLASHRAVAMQGCTTAFRDPQRFSAKRHPGRPRMVAELQVTTRGKPWSYSG